MDDGLARFEGHFATVESAAKRTGQQVNGVDQFADSWRVELGDPATGETIELAYTVRRLPEPIG